ncbi:DUF563 domain-containing protein [Acidisoma sp. S159]|jgi:hypothetical protein|uniref:glycosyltransferase family 61 protein n=1 Tax=Acidisoma sp. S159 TaxID=1747225 RepID=UPI00131E53B6|nr:glycosyltransferase family 61 protein [Acidisoma sp. S159]
MAPVPETSIGQVAARTNYIERSQPLPSPVAILGRGFDRPDYADLFRPRLHSANIRNYHLENVHLDTAAMTLFKNGMKIRESNYLVPLEFYENACVIETDLIKLESVTEHVMARSFDNYYHWLVQTIPGLDWSARNIGPDNITLLSGDLKPWQAEILEILGYDRVSRIALDPRHHYFIPRLEYSEFQNGSTAFEISLSAQRVYDRLAAAAMDGTPVDAKILYVARTDSANRAAENEEALIRLLEAEGVRVVVPGSLSVPQQVNLFGKARAVLGPHGAGLTNVVFCRPGTIFYELLPSHYLNPCFSRLAQAAGLEYQIDLFDSAETVGEDPHMRGWILDTDLILSRVVEIKHRISAARSKRTAAPIPPEPEAASPLPLLAETTHLVIREKPAVEASGFLSRVWRRVLQ